MNYASQFVTAALAALIVAASCAAADPVTGWRGDGTGKYPSADPPAQWQRISPLIKGLRYSATEVKEADAGKPMPDGVVREWLVLGPVPFSKEVKIDKEALAGEAALAPEEGLKTGDRTWKKVTLDSAYLDFAALLGKADEAVVFACTHVCSDTGGAFRLNLTSPGPARIYVNGKPGPLFSGRIKIDLAKGWNRLLLKVGHSKAAREESWYAVAVFHAFSPSTCEESGIAWHVALPGVQMGFYGGGQGVAAPLVIGDRIYVRSEPFDLIALAKADGKVLWLRRASYFEAATDEEKKKAEYKDAEALAARIDAVNAAFVAGTATEKQLQEKTELERSLQKEMKKVDPEKYAIGSIPDIGWSGFTPVSDGERIYVWSSSGLVACYHRDGRLLWTRLARNPDAEHGLSSSPVLADGKIVIFNRDLVAFDAKTGAPAWTTPIVTHEGLNPGGFFHGSLIATTAGGVPLIALGNGTIVRATDGKKLYENKASGGLSVASPVVEGGTVYDITEVESTSTLHMYPLPARIAEPLFLAPRKMRIDTSAFPVHYLPWHLSSPVIHEGLAYLVNNAGVLTVVDIQAGQVVYQKLLDLDVFQGHNEGAARGVGASLALAGKYIYVVGNNGATIVLEPGRMFKQVAKNKIESVAMAGHWAERQERFMANPVFDGQRLYLRGEKCLYCIGRK